MNPALGLSRIRVRDEPKGYFNREEFAAVRMSAANYYLLSAPNLPCAELNTRLLAFVDCLRWSGLRIGDGIKLDRSRLDTKNRIQLYQQKTGVHVFLPIPASVAERQANERCPVSAISSGTATTTRARCAIINMR